MVSGNDVSCVRLPHKWRAHEEQTESHSSF